MALVDWMKSVFDGKVCACVCVCVCVCLAGRFSGGVDGGERRRAAVPVR